jgi:hypothetical protein
VLIGGDKALRLVEPVGEAPDTVDLDLAVLRIQGLGSLAMQRDSSLSG